MFSIGRVSISIIGWNRIIVALNSGTIPCVALELLKRRHASVVPQDELRNYFRPRRTMGERVSLAEQRRAFLQRLFTLKDTGGEIKKRG
jgi:hypothetical protein